MKTKIQETNLSKFESIPFAVIFWSSILGWTTMSTPDSPLAARKSFDACDSGKKMLLNYGMIIAEQKPD